MNLEERVQRLEDRSEINDLVVRYFLSADGDDFEGIAASFTEDAEFSSSGVVTACGREGIVEFIRRARSQMGLTIHTPHYAHVTFRDADTAAGLVGAHLELDLGGQMVLGAVRYVDDYVRSGGSWRIRRRDMRTIHIAPWLEVGEAFSSSTPTRWPGATPLQSDYPRQSNVGSSA